MTHHTEPKLPESLEAIRAALAAGPTPGPWIIQWGRQQRYPLGIHNGDVNIVTAIARQASNEAVANALLFAACNPEAISELLDALKARDAEIERLRGRAPKDLPTRIQVSYSPDDWDTFIYGVSGHLTIEALTAIDASIHDDAEALFDKGPGEYVLGASYFQGQYGFEGRCEIASGWELEVESFRPLYAAIDQARATGGEKANADQA